MPRRAVVLVPAAALLFAAIVASPTRAQPPGPPPGPRTGPPGAARDTTWFDALARQGWLELGFGWVSAPRRLRERLEAGQGLAGGLQARPSAGTALRAGLDYQTLVASGRGRYEPVPGSAASVDTASFEITSRAWSFGLRAEAGWRAPGAVWLFAGGAREYFDGGQDDFLGLETPDVRLRLSEAAPDGWGWSTSLGVARSFHAFLPWPIGLDVRWRSLRRRGEDLQTWTIRLATMRD